MQRITTAQSFDTGVERLQKRQAELADAQVRLTSGKRVSKASDDPTAAARAERALATEARSQASQRALEASRNAMALTESSLADAGDPQRHDLAAEHADDAVQRAHPRHVVCAPPLRLRPAGSRRRCRFRNGSGSRG